MAVVIKLMEASAKSTVQSDGRLIRNYRHRYRYKTDAGTRPTFADIAADLGIAPGSPYADDANATAGEVEIEHVLSRPPHCMADLVVTWATNNPVPEEIDTDPTTTRVEWSARPTIQQRYIIRDRHGDLITNSAGSPYDGGIPVDVRLGQVIAKVKIPAVSYDREATLANSGAVNSEEYLGGAAGTVQVDITADERVEGGYAFVEVSYTFNYDPDGWQPKPADVGFFQLGIGGIPVPITVGDLASPPTSNATKVPEPEPLDGTGHVVPFVDRPDGCAFKEVDYFPSMDFAEFGLI